MRLFGFEITKAAPRTAAAVDTRLHASSSWFSRIIHEPFSGAWQRNIECESAENILKFSAVYACVDLISSDIAKLRIKLVERQQDDIWREITSPAFSPVLRKPNRYQTRIQFLSHWITSKLLYGNTYVLKERDARNVVVALYVLDPQRVTPLVTDGGDVWYQLQPDNLSQVPSGDFITVPASEIIHDRMLTLWHPLVGVSPIYACGASATQGIRIQANSERFFSNMSRPSGVLKFPTEIKTETAREFKEAWEAGHSGINAGKVAVLSHGMEYVPIAIPASDAQLIEQLRWTVEDICRVFHVPAYKLNVGSPTLSNFGQLNQDYYAQALQSLIEAMELLLDEGMALPPDLGTELDLDNLLRMDPVSLADANEKGIRAGYLSPNEARQKANLTPVEGGESPYMQQQNFSLEALARRDSIQAPPGLIPTAVEPVEETEQPQPKALDEILLRALSERFDAAARACVEQAVIPQGTSG